MPLLTQHSSMAIRETERWRLVRVLGRAPERRRHLARTSARILAKWLDPIDYERAAFHWSYRYHKHEQLRATDSLHHIRSSARDQFRQTKIEIHTTCSIMISPNSCVFACASFQPLCCYPSNHSFISCSTTSRADLFLIFLWLFSMLHTFGVCHHAVTDCRTRSDHLRHLLSIWAMGLLA